MRAIQFFSLFTVLAGMFVSAAFAGNMGRATGGQLVLSNANPAVVSSLILATEEGDDGDESGGDDEGDDEGSGM
ncbi:MAG: hypothetical protein OEW12_01490 [Deltaproteobacteria bacterium]|nr:hypothetical protein [Deltaproteobacteria bacterium]